MSHNMHGRHLAPFVSMSSFLVWGTRTTVSWHFRLILLFTVYVSTKPSNSKSGSLYPYQWNQSGLGLGLVLEIDRCQAKR